MPYIVFHNHCQLHVHAYASRLEKSANARVGRKRKGRQKEWCGGIGGGISTTFFELLRSVKINCFANTNNGPRSIHEVRALLSHVCRVQGRSLTLFSVMAGCGGHSLCERVEGTESGRSETAHPAAAGCCNGSPEHGRQALWFVVPIHGRRPAAGAPGYLPECESGQDK